jgi:hypothetical protein
MHGLSAVSLLENVSYNSTTMPVLRALAERWLVGLRVIVTS